MENKEFVARKLADAIELAAERNPQNFGHVRKSWEELQEYQREMTLTFSECMIELWPEITAGIPFEPLEDTVSDALEQD